MDCRSLVRASRVCGTGGGHLKEECTALNLLNLFRTGGPSNKNSDPESPQNRSPIELPVRQSDVRCQYERAPSFTDLLPWVEYLPDSQCFLLEDGQSLGAILELQPVGTEARDDKFMTNLRNSIQVALTDAIPEHETSPWVLQLFVQDQHDLSSLDHRLRKYGTTVSDNSEYRRFFQDDFSRHIQRITAPGGMYEDKAVTGARWRGQIRSVRAILYQRWRPQDLKKAKLEDAEQSLQDTVSRFSAALAVTGVTFRRGTHRDFYRWLFSWFNPQPDTGLDTLGTYENLGITGDPKELPFGHDFAESLVLSVPNSAARTGVWWFDGLPHTFVSMQTLRQIPPIGGFTAERTSGSNTFALFDQFPEHTIMSMTITVKSQTSIRNHVGRIRRAAVGDTADAQLTREDADAVERQIARGNKLYPMSLGFYVRGNDLAELNRNVTSIHALLLSNGIQSIARESDLFPLDSYIRNLPMAYDPHLDTIRRRSRLVFSRHAANLLPIYGRNRGTGHGGLVFFNRGAEPIDFDPLHPDDRKKNAHMLILGPTGAGKSALLVYLLQQMIARHRPRVFVIEAGGSFTLLGQHFAAHGLSVNQVTLSADSNVSLPPFCDAVKVLDDDDSTDLEDSSEDFARDRLGEMEIVARVMITGGDSNEDDRVSRSDRLFIRNSILDAARKVRDEGSQDVLIDDVVDALRSLANSPETAEIRKIRAGEMADSMALFCSGVAGRLFNRPGTPWPDVDVTILEMGLLAREGYEDQLTVAYLSMMSHINDLVEKNQHSDRPTLVVTDEGHLITTHPLLANYVVKITKMWRKLGAWFWIATQNLADFPDASRRMLNMMEWWLCLVMPKEEIDQIARFRDLSDDQRLLLLSARKEPGKYVEGVVLSDKIETLFRNVPPALSLALAMSEKHEKAQRRKIMEEKGCSEVEAAYEVAAHIFHGTSRS